MAGFLGGSVRIIDAEHVRAKLAVAAPHILAHNRMMIEEMLNQIKPMVIAQTPLGPGHFGYHLRDSYETDVKSAVVRSWGVLKAPATGYWYEFGTLGKFKKGSANVANASNARAAFAGVFGHGWSGKAVGFGGTSGGEGPHMIAHHALNIVNRIINTFYGGRASWFGLP